jgi:hypothetical protein
MPIGYENAGSVKVTRLLALNNRQIIYSDKYHLTFGATMIKISSLFCVEFEALTSWRNRGLVFIILM